MFNISVLIVDDSRVIIESIKYILKDYVDTIYIAKDGEDGLNIFKKYRPDILITDIEMPKMNGFELAEKIKLIESKTPIILISQYSNPQTLRRAIRLNIKDFIFKPIDNRELREQFLNIVKEYQTSMELSRNLNLSYFALNSSPLGIFYCNREGELLYANDSMLKMSGYSKEEFLNLNLKNYPIYSELDISEKIEFVIEHKFIIFETLIKRKDSKLIPVEVTSNYLEKEGIICAYHSDISDRNALEDMIRKKNSKLKKLNRKLELKVESEIKKRLDKEVLISTIFNTSKLGIVITDMGTIVRVNEAFCKMSQFSKSEIISKDFLSLIPKEDIELIKFLCREYLEANKSCIIETKLKLKNSTYIDVSLSKSNIKDLNNRDLKLHIFTDITHIKEIEREQKRQEELLIQQSKMAQMGEMIGAIAHQWKQPLNVLSGILINIDISSSLGKLEPELLTESIERANEQIQFMAQTIDDFRNFFKPSKRESKFNLKDAIESMIDILKNQFKNHEIEVKVLGENLSILGYSNEFKQVILNILNNSKDAILSKQSEDKFKKFYGEIEISISKDEDFTKIEISDNAGGVDEKILPKIFEPYFSTKGKNGTGIGLHICKTIIENNFSGSITAKNIDSGAKFIIKVANV